MSDARNSTLFLYFPFPFRGESCAFYVALVVVYLVRGLSRVPDVPAGYSVDRGMRHREGKLWQRDGVRMLPGAAQGEGGGGGGAGGGENGRNRLHVINKLRH